MIFFAIVCEFNPFHTGHKYLIEQTKLKTNTEGIVCVMSGSMVQRGDVAIYDKWTRARAAVQNGADLVLELPVTYVLQSAEVFAKGATELINAIGCEGISFGSECVDISMLMKMAELKINEPPLYTKKLKDELKKGIGYPTACHHAATEVLGYLPKELTLPNSTLGVSYIANALKINPKLKFHIEQRIGDYHSTEAVDGFASATAIRQKIMSGDKINQYSLCTSDDIYDINNISAYILGFFRTADEKSLAGISGMEDGLAARLIEMSKRNATYESFIKACVTKRYTYHRIRRVILCSLLGITDAPSPTYARVLALNSKGAQILKDIKKNNNIEIITKLAKASDTNNKMLRKDILATDIAALCAGKEAAMDYKKSPVVI